MKKHLKKLSISILLALLFIGCRVNNQSSEPISNNTIEISDSLKTGDISTIPVTKEKPPISKTPLLESKEGNQFRTGTISTK